MDPETIRLKDINKMTLEEALFVINNLIINTTVFPCGVCHTNQAWYLISEYIRLNEIKKG